MPQPVDKVAQVVVEESDELEVARVGLGDGGRFASEDVSEAADDEEGQRDTRSIVSLHARDGPHARLTCE